MNPTHNVPPGNVRNPYIEKVLDYAMPLKKCAPYGIAKAVMGYYGRVVTTGVALTKTFTNIHERFFNTFDPVKRRRITAEDIEKGFFETSKLPAGTNISKEKLQFVLNTTEKLRLQMGFRKEVKVYSSESASDSTMTQSSRLSIHDFSMFISFQELILSEDALEFTIAHELSHIANYDQLQELIFSGVVLTVDLVAAHFFGPFAIPIIEGVVSPQIENYHSRYCEKQADIKAMKVLNSSKAMLSFLEAQIELTKRAFRVEQNIKAMTPETYWNDESYYYRFLKNAVHLCSKDTVVSVVNPSHDNRLDLNHPPLSERLQYAKAFKPKIAEPFC